MNFLRKLFCLGPKSPAKHPTGDEVTPFPVPPDGGKNGDGGSKPSLVSRLRDELQREYEKEPRLAPFIRLLEAVDAADIDFRSSEVDKILRQMRELNEPSDDEKSKPKWTVFESRPFFDDEDPAKTSVEHILVKDGFSNWGKNVTFEPSYTLVVRSIAGLQRVVKWAAANAKKVRVSGFRHSWSEIFGASGDVIVMFLPYHTMVDLPYQQPPADWKSELRGIELVDSVSGRQAPSGHAYVKIMAGTTSEQLRQWCFDNKAWCISCNVIMLEVTFGGSNGSICHGAGLQTTTMSDLVVELTYVDARGDLQTINDPAELRAASGAFGLLGVVVSITLQLDTMGVVDMMPVKVPVALAIPPPKGYKIPEEVQMMCESQGITADMLSKAQEDFVHRCETDFYLEWFWFPYQEEVWVNTWQKRNVTPKDLDLKEYPGDSWLTGTKSQEVQASLAEAVINYTPFRLLSGHLQAYLFAAASLFALPDVKDPNDAIKTFASEAIHFRRGIQNFRCWDSEWELPIPSHNGKRDYEMIQRAWWDGITAIYSRSDAPVRVALEMRLTGGSNIILAPQRGNEGTASIEVLTTLITPKDEWQTFMQEVADHWTSYDLKDDTGKVLYPRPHWAKQWAGLTVRGKPVEEYLKDVAYPQAFSDFRTAVTAIATRTGVPSDETRARFGNALMDRLIYSSQ